MGQKLVLLTHQQRALAHELKGDCSQLSNNSRTTSILITGGICSGRYLGKYYKMDF